MKYKIILIAFLFPFLGCQDFLEEVPTDRLPMETAIESVQDCKSFLNGVYSSFKNTAALAVSGTLGPELQTDLMALIQGNQQTLSSFHNWNFNSQSAEISALWQSYYMIIFRANYLLTGIEKVKTQLTEDLASVQTTAERDTINKNLGVLQDYRAQCCMARAFCRVELVKLFAGAYQPDQAATQLALPLWDKSEIGTPQRVSMEKYYAAVLEDLKVAATMPAGAPDNIYFTKGSVRALETRVHVYMHNWKAAISSATDVIKSYGYELLNAADTVGLLSTPYAKMWSEDKGNEIIWKIGYTSSEERLGSLGAIFYGIDQSGKFYPDYMPTGKLIKLYDKRDARFPILFMERTTSYTHGLTILAFRKYPGNQALNYNSNVDRCVNMPKVFRLSEIYLLRAEAYYHDRNEAGANDDLNDLKEKRIVGYLDQNLSGDALLQEIKNERIRELCMEGHRLYDLKRYGEGFAREDIEGGVPASNSIKVTPGDLRFIWPIPKRELDIPNSQMVGNPSNRL